jgi:multicomponent K+:H+ antiporter subunit E
MNNRIGLPQPLLSATLLALWLLLNGSLAPGQWLLGALFAWLLPLALRRLQPPTVPLQRPLLLVPFLLRVTLDIVAANLRMIALIARPHRQLQPALIEMPLELRGELAIGLLAATISLTPGTIAADLSADRRTLLIHALHAPDQQALIAQIKRQYERPLREIFGC